MMSEYMFVLRLFILAYCLDYGVAQRRSDLDDLMALVSGNIVGGTTNTPEYKNDSNRKTNETTTDISTTTTTKTEEFLCAFGRLFNSRCEQVSPDQQPQSQSSEQNGNPLLAGAASFPLAALRQAPTTTRAPLDLFQSAYLPNTKKKCTPNQNTGKCMYYDTHVQAATLREAIINFSDLTNGNVMKSMPSRADRQNGKCVTDECRACTQQVVHWISDHSNWLNKYEAAQLLRLLNADQQVSTTCKRISLAQTPETTPIPDRRHNTTVHYAKMCLKIAEKLMNPEQLAPTRQELIARAGIRQRGKRQVDDSLIGERVIVKCVKRGYAADDSAKHVSLCSQCWTFRKLPADYYPRYVNELVCTGGDDQDCFGGYGACMDHPRPVQVQRTLQSPKITIEENLSVSACCDCRMPATSPLIPFIQV